MTWLRRISASAAWISGLHRRRFARVASKSSGAAGVSRARSSRWVGRSSGAPTRATSLLPAPAVAVLGVPEGDPGPAGFDLGLEEVGLVRLADVHELLGGPDGVVVHAGEVAVDGDQALRGDDLEVAGADAVQDPEPLGVGLKAGGGRLLGELRPAEPELPTGDDLLLDESAHQFAGGRPAPGDDPSGRGLRLAEGADLLLDVADGGVRVEPCLERAAEGGVDLGGGLPEGGIPREGQPLEVGEAREGREASYRGRRPGRRRGRHRIREGGGERRVQRAPPRCGTTCRGPVPGRPSALGRPGAGPSREAEHRRQASQRRPDPAGVDERRVGRLRPARRDGRGHRSLPARLAESARSDIEG